MIEAKGELIGRAMVALIFFFDLNKFVYRINIFFSNINSHLIIFYTSVFLTSCINNSQNQVSGTKIDSLNTIMQFHIDEGSKYCDTLLFKISHNDTISKEEYIYKIKTSEKEASSIFDTITDWGRKGIIKQNEYDLFISKIHTDSIQNKIQQLKNLGISW